MEKVATLLPICSVCTVHLFAPNSPLRQLSCKHVFCQDCLPDLASAGLYTCPFDGTLSEAYSNAELTRIAVEATVAFQHLTDPRCLPFLEACYAYLMQSVNTEKVPCRVFYQTKDCPNRLACPYDHSPGLSTRGICPKGLECTRRPRCVFDHQPPYVHRPLALQYHQVSPWYNDMKHRLAFIELQADSQEYRSVQTRFAQSVSSPVIRIERVMNAEAYMKFAYKHESLSALKGALLLNMLLFHGTSKANPYSICGDPNGVDSRMSKERMWGRGSYFAKNAIYSQCYRHELGEHFSAILLCEVIVGDYIELPNDSSLSRPPLKPDNSGEYHSIKGRTANEDIWITYEPGMSYTRYIITF